MKKINTFYPGTIYVLASAADDRAFRKKFPECDLPELLYGPDGDLAATGERINLRTHKRLYIMRFNLDAIKQTTDSSVASVVAHECTHIKQLIYSHIGETQNMGRISEAEAYFMDYLVFETYNYLKGLNRASKRQTVSKTKTRRNRRS